MLGNGKKLVIAAASVAALVCGRAAMAASVSLVAGALPQSYSTADSISLTGTTLLASNLNQSFTITNQPNNGPGTIEEQGTGSTEVLTDGTNDYFVYQVNLITPPTGSLEEISGGDFNTAITAQGYADSSLSDLPAAAQAGFGTPDGQGATGEMAEANVGAVNFNEFSPEFTSGESEIFVVQVASPNTIIEPGTFSVQDSNAFNLAGFEVITAPLPSSAFGGAALLGLVAVGGFAKARRAQA